MVAFWWSYVCFSGFFKAPPYTSKEKGFKDLDVLSQNSICLTSHYKPNSPNPVASCNHFMNFSKTNQPNKPFVSSGPNPGWLFYIAGYTKHDTGLIISRKKDPVMVTCHVRLSLSSNDLSPHLSRPSALPLVQTTPSICTKSVGMLGTPGRHHRGFFQQDQLSAGFWEPSSKLKMIFWFSDLSGVILSFFCRFSFSCTFFCGVMKWLNHCSKPNGVCCLSRPLWATHDLNGDIAMQRLVWPVSLDWSP